MNKAKEWLWPLVNLSLVAAVLLGFSATAYFYRSSKSLVPSRTFVVTAEGKTVVSPDLASFNFSVVSEGTDPEKLSAENSKKVNATIDFVKSEAVESKDIKTANYSLSPRYEYDEKLKKTFISGYTLTQTVFVKLRDFSKVGKILAKLPDLGVNEISALAFSVEDPDRYLKEARKQAFEKAFIKAKEMARQNRARIGKVVTFSEYPNSQPPFPIYATFEKSGGAGPLPAPQIEPGTQEVTVSVNVTYEIR